MICWNRLKDGSLRLDREYLVVPSLRGSESRYQSAAGRVRSIASSLAF